MLPNLRTVLTKILLTTLLLVGLTAGVQGQSAPTAIRFAHAVPGLDAIDIYANEVLVVSGLENGTATTYLNVDSAPLNLRVTLAGLTTTLWEQPFAPRTGDNTTLLAYTSEPLNFASFRDDPTPLPLGSARLIVIHAIADGPAVDFTVNDEEVVGDVQPGGFVNSIDVPAGVYSMALTASEGGEVVIPATQVALTSLTTHMLVAYGTASAPQAVVFTTATRPEADADAGLIRFAHGIPGAAAVNVLLDGALLIPDLAYGEVTEHLALPVGDYNVVVQNAETDEEISAVELAVSAGAAVTAAVIVNADDEATIRLLTDAVDAVTTETAAVRVISTVADSSVTLPDGTTLEGDGEATLDAISGDMTVSIDGEDTITPVTLYGGVYYSVLVLQDGTLSIAPTSINQGLTSAPGAEAAPQVAVVPTATTDIAAATPIVIVVTATPETAGNAATAAPEISVPPVVPTSASPTGRIVLDSGANLQLREYPSSDAKSLGLAPSGTI
ncbi:MAG: DUF4397 domain-containing protein, partial [Armatimonadetes bacterium]|nr:DUF4397 domain-containing protein [Anaerolineae bacterium]